MFNLFKAKEKTIEGYTDFNKKEVIEQIKKLKDGSLLKNRFLESLDSFKVFMKIDLEEMNAAGDDAISLYLEETPIKKSNSIKFPMYFYEKAMIALSDQMYHESTYYLIESLKDNMSTGKLSIFEWKMIKSWVLSAFKFIENDNTYFTSLNKFIQSETFIKIVQLAKNNELGKICLTGLYIFDEDDEGEMIGIKSAIEAKGVKEDGTNAFCEEIYFHTHGEGGIASSISTMRRDADVSQIQGMITFLEGYIKSCLYREFATTSLYIERDMKRWDQD